MQSHQKHEQPVGPQIPEEQYAYYRRCQRFRKNGQQCKAPAMKDQDVCYKHEEQAAAEHRRQAMLQSLQLPPVRDLASALRAIQNVAQAIIDDRIDLKTAGMALDRLQSASARLGQVAGGPRSRVFLCPADKEL